MRPKGFENILQMVAQMLFKENTTFRNSVSPTVKQSISMFVSINFKVNSVIHM